MMERKEKKEREDKIKHHDFDVNQFRKKKTRKQGRIMKKHSTLHSSHTNPGLSVRNLLSSPGFSTKKAWNLSRAHITVWLMEEGNEWMRQYGNPGHQQGWMLNRKESRKTNKQTNKQTNKRTKKANTITDNGQANKELQAKITLFRRIDSVGVSFLQIIIRATTSKLNKNEFENQNTIIKNTKKIQI
jgi:hypothetical protein